MPSASSPPARPTREQRRPGHVAMVQDQQIPGGVRALETPQREQGFGLSAGEGAEQTAIFHRTQTAGTVLNGTC